MTFIGVCGGRNYTDREKVYRMLKTVTDDIPGPVAIVAGGASGADKLDRDWAIESGTHYVEVPANWTMHGRSAGPQRNAVMAAIGLEVLVAFPGGSGTADMVRRCRELGDVRIVEVL